MPRCYTIMLCISLDPLKKHHYNFEINSPRLPVFCNSFLKNKPEDKLEKMLGLQISETRSCFLVPAYHDPILFEYSHPAEESRCLNVRAVFFQIKVIHQEIYFVVSAGV